MNFISRIKYITVFFLCLILGISCSTTEEATTSEETPAMPADTVSAETEEFAALNLILSNNRSQLSDLYLSQQHDMPQAFLKKKADNESLNNNPEDGYRVQILSTRNIDLADSVEIDFRTWADTTIKGYTAQSYISFNQPYYRVHVGDFQQRSKANSFSKLVKKQFPDAWVVHDRIEPDHVPADTASFSLKSNKDRLKEKKLEELDQDTLKDKNSDS